MPQRGELLSTLNATKLGGGALPPGSELGFHQKAKEPSALRINDGAIFPADIAGVNPFISFRTAAVLVLILRAMSHRTPPVMKATLTPTADAFTLKMRSKGRHRCQVR